MCHGATGYAILQESVARARVSSHRFYCAFVTKIDYLSTYYSILLILCQLTSVYSRGSQYSSSHDFPPFLAFCSAIMQ